MKPIEIEIDERPQSGTIDRNGDFQFYVYASNQCEDEFEEALETLKNIWDLPADVSLKINIRLKHVYEDLFEFNSVQGKIGKVDAHLFDSLKKDCQWIIDQIDELERDGA